MTNISEPQTPIYAVITGDIVGSTKLSVAALTHVRVTVGETIRSFASRNPEVVSNRPEFFSGDSWQVLLKEPRAALRLALLVQARLVAVSDVETRAAIGIGSVARLEKNLATSTGEAFTLSGRALEAITNSFRLTGALPARSVILARWFPAILHMCSGLMSGWTRRQAEVVGLWLSLPNPTHEHDVGPSPRRPKCAKHFSVPGNLSFGFTPLQIVEYRKR